MTFSTDNLMPIAPPENQLQYVVADFLEGAPFTEQLCDRIIASYDLTIPPERLSYKRSMEFVKTIIDRSSQLRIGSQLYAIDADFDFTQLEIALVIRLLNLCYHGERILVLNNRIIYIPKTLRNRTEEELRQFAYRSIQDAAPNWFGRLVRSLRRKLSRPVKAPRNYNEPLLVI